ncbi:hypothetical protein GY45DRAFT_90830 [Cubamyces sp. BRFM 1775]|nr:hypothetical protein GY45DRAFT_90830 [Cubamyces sp. BRFM 1775]
MLFTKQSRVFATAATVVVALIATTAADPVPMAQHARAESSPIGVDDSTGLHTVVYASHAELMAWISTIDPSLLTYTGPSNATSPDLASLPEADTTVVYCAKRSGSSCAAPCTVHVGGPGCIYAPGTSCLAATADVSFCSTSDCTRYCNAYSTCGIKLDEGYCWTPNTNSIFVIPH